jgi:hypothetical protein
MRRGARKALWKRSTRSGIATAIRFLRRPVRVARAVGHAADREATRGVVAEAREWLVVVTRGFGVHGPGRDLGEDAGREGSEGALGEGYGRLFAGEEEDVAFLLAVHERREHLRRDGGHERHAERHVDARRDLGEETAEGHAFDAAGIEEEGVLIRERDREAVEDSARQRVEEAREEGPLRLRHHRRHHRPRRRARRRDADGERERRGRGPVSIVAERRGLAERDRRAHERGHRREVGEGLDHRDLAVASEEGEGAFRKYGSAAVERDGVAEAELDRRLLGRGTVDRDARERAQETYHP